MLLDEAMDTVIRRSTSLKGATRMLFSMFDANLIDDGYHYVVRPYIVQGHNRRRRINLRAVKGGKVSATR